MIDPGAKLIVATIVALLIAGFAEGLDWLRNRNSPHRSSTLKRGLGYVTLYAVVLVLAFVPEVGRVVEALGKYLWILGLLVVVLAFLLIRFGIPLLNRVFEEARHLDEAGRTLDAITLLENHRPTAKRWSKSFEALLLCNVAGYYAKLNDTSRALAAVDEAVAASPPEAVVHSTKASLLCDFGRPEEALSVLEAALPRFEKSVALQTALAEVRVKLGRMAEAATTLARIDELLDRDKYVDVMDRSEWRRVRLDGLRLQIADKAADSGNGNDMMPPSAE